MTTAGYDAVAGLTPAHLAEEAAPHTRRRNLVVAVVPSAIHALEWCVNDVYRDGDHIYVVHVVPCLTPKLEIYHGVPGTSYKFDDPAAPHKEVAEVKQAKRFVEEKVHPILDGRSIPHEVHLAVDTLDAPPGAIADVISSVAAQAEATLVVIGATAIADSKQESPLDLVARHCLSNFKFPIAIVR